MLSIPAFVLILSPPKDETLQTWVVVVSIFFSIIDVSTICHKFCFALIGSGYSCSPNVETGSEQIAVLQVDGDAATLRLTNATSFPPLLLPQNHNQSSPNDVALYFHKASISPDMDVPISTVPSMDGIM